MDTNNITKMDREELEKAKEEAKKADNLFVLKFKKPFTYESVDYDELEFDFDGLTGNDSLEVEKELARQGTQVAVPAFSGEYIIRIAARACTTLIGSDAFRLMSLKDYNRVRAKVRNFLMASES